MRHLVPGKGQTGSREHGCWLSACFLPITQSCTPALGRVSPHWKCLHRHTQSCVCTKSTEKNLHCFQSFPSGPVLIIYKRFFYTSHAFEHGSQTHAKTGLTVALSHTDGVMERSSLHVIGVSCLPFPSISIEAQKAEPVLAGPKLFLVLLSCCLCSSFMNKL